MNDGWTVSDSPQAPSSGGWQVSDSPTPAQANFTDNPNGEGVYQMKAPSGQTVGVPYSKVVDARNQGHSFADDNEQGRFNKDSAYANRPQNHIGSVRGGVVNTAIDSAENFGSHLWNDAKGAVEAVAAPPSTPDETAVAGTPAGRLGLAGYRMLAKPSVDAAVTAVDEAKKGNLFKKDEYDHEGNYQPSAFSSAVDAIPVAGPWARQIETEAHQKGAIPALTGAAADVAFGEATGKVGGKVMDWTGQHTPVEGENYTPIQHRALSGVLARGTGMGKDFFPKDVAETIASPVRQVVADHPELAKAIHEGTPEDSIGAFQKALDISKEKIDVAHQQALGPVRDTPFDMAPVQQAVTFPKSLEGFAPEDADAIADLRTRLGNVKTLDGANELRMWLNRELAPEFRKNAAAGGRSGAVDSAMSSALSALRDPYYEALEKASGQDFSGLKRTEGGIIKAQEAMGNVAPELAKKQALATEPKSPKQALADALKGGRTIHGGPVTGTANLIAEKVLGSTPLGDVQAGLQRVFSKLPNESAPAAATASPLQLPRPQYPQLPANVPANAEFGPGGQTPPLASPAAATTFNVDPHGQVRPGEPAPRTPAVVTPEPAPTLQLPAVASPEGTVEPQPNPGTPPPPVNEATARMRVQPLPENPEPTPPSPAGFTVGPDGVARREPAGALPAPAPKPKAAAKVKPAMSHPSGDVTAIDEKTGLPIVRRNIPAATEPDGGAAPAQAAATPPEQRPVVQASANPDELRASAEQQKPVMQDMAEKAVEGVPGAKVEGMRVKDADSVENKADRGKPPETISDHLGARVSAPTPEGVEQVKRNVEAQLPVAQADKITNNGVDADQYAVQTGNPGEPNQQSELQVVTKPQADAMKATDGLYSQQKEAMARGDQAEADRLGKQIEEEFKKANQQGEPAAVSAARKYLADNELGKKPGDTAAVNIRGNTSSLDAQGSKYQQAEKTVRDWELKQGLDRSKQVAARRKELQPHEDDAVAYYADRLGKTKAETKETIRSLPPSQYVKTIEEYLAKANDDGARGTSSSSPSNEGAKREVAPAFSKGDRVTLPDGRPGTVQFYDGKITRNARVKLDDGSMVTSVKGSELKAAQQHVDTAPIGTPLPQRVQQIKDELAKGTDVRIFSARVANDPEGIVRAQIEDWAEKNLGRKVPVTNAKDDGMAFLLDDKANVTPNSNERFQIPAIPKGKWLGVDLDKTLAEDENNAQPRISSGADANAKAEGGGNVPAQKETATAGSTGNASPGVTSGKDAVGSQGGKQGAEKSWAETVKAKKAAAKQQTAEAHGLMAGDHGLGGPELDAAADSLRVYFEGQEREHGANALKAIHKSVEEAADETDAGAGKQPVQRMEKGRSEGAQGSDAGKRDE